MSEETAKLNQKQDDRIKALEEGQGKILAILEPMADNYMATLILGKWFMGAMLFLGTLISIGIGIKTLIK